MDVLENDTQPFSKECHDEEFEKLTHPDCNEFQLLWLENDTQPDSKEFQDGWLENVTHPDCIDCHDA